MSLEERREIIFDADEVYAALQNVDSTIAPNWASRPAPIAFPQTPPGVRHAPMHCNELKQPGICAELRKSRAELIGYGSLGLRYNDVSFHGYQGSGVCISL